MKNVKIVKQGRGQNLRIGIYGNDNERQDWLNFFYNSGATDSETLLTNERPNFGYFNVEEKKFRRGMVGRELVRLAKTDREDELKKRAGRTKVTQLLKEEAEMNAEIWFSSIPEENFDVYRPGRDLSEEMGYGMGYLEKEGDDEE